jgi:hypothetical protein
MNTPEINLIPRDLMAELQQAAESASRGIRDPEGRKEACDEMDRIREEIRAQHGVLDIGVPAIRELRDA